MTSIASVGRAFPEHYYSQEVLSSALKKHWAKRHHNLDRLDQLHRNVLVGGRHLALPIEAYEALDSFAAANEAYTRTAVDVGARAAEDALSRAGLRVEDVDHLFFVSTTGIATPSIDATLVNRLGFRTDVKRTPVFGLGCAAGAAGLARAADYLRAFPEAVALLVSVELTSLTLQREDLSIPNIIATGLFGDAAAAVVLLGADRRATGPKVLASRSRFYPDTERVMGWDVTEKGFKVVLSGEIPDLVRREIRGDVETFLDARGLALGDITTYVCHPGGPKIVEAFRETLELPEDALTLTWESLETVGNVSSASVLLVLGDTLSRRSPPHGAYGLLMAMGPGFCSELVLLQW